MVISNIDGGQPQLLVNRTENENRWLKVTLEGTASNRDTVGARVVLERTDGHNIMQEVKAGGSYQSTSTKSLFFGLADADVEQLTVRWPSGQIKVLEEVPSDTILHIVEDEDNSIATGS